MRAIGVPMEGRGTRADEYLAVMRSLWSDDAPEFHGRHVEFEGVDAHPKPAQRPVPVVVGGHTAAAHRRTARHADGWYGFMQDRAQTADQIESLRVECEAVGRDFAELEITVSPAERPDGEVVADYAELGVHRLALVPPPDIWTTASSVTGLEEFVREYAPAQLGAEQASA
jgi:hypothetical protein